MNFIIEKKKHTEEMIKLHYENNNENINRLYRHNHILYTECKSLKMLFHLYAHTSTRCNGKDIVF